MARQYDQAIDQERKTLDLDPNFMTAHTDLGLFYVKKSMYKEGIAELEQALVISPSNTFALSYLAYGYAVAGKRAEAQKVLNQLNQISKQNYVDPVLVAKIYIGLGEKDKAFYWLEKGYEDLSAGTSWKRVTFAISKVDPIFDPLRSDPRFADLLRRMNLQP